jgi:hypothetical protein
VLDTVEHQGLRHPLDAAAARVHQGHIGTVESRQVVLVEGRPLYQGFSASAVAGSVTVESTRARIWFIFLKSASSI